MTSIFVVLLVFILLSILRRNHHKLLATKYRYELYSLRDKLRQIVIDKKVSKNEWAFKYLDSSISKMVGQLPTVNLWTSIYLAIYYRNDESIPKFQFHLNQAFQRNEVLKSIHVEYGELLVKYTIKRHIVTLILTFLGVQSIKECRRFFIWFKQILLDVRETPQTSTMLRYAQ